MSSMLMKYKRMILMIFIMSILCAENNMTIVVIINFILRKVVQKPPVITFESGISIQRLCELSKQYETIDIGIDNQS